MIEPLLHLAAARRKGSSLGIASVCSAHPLVIRAAVRHAARHAAPLLIEATCNQVNQFGGYTGMRPADFARLVFDIAAEEGLPGENIILGGDHLGPNPWRKEPSAAAMAKAEEMVAAYVAAGFRKIHLDASMGCAGEPAALDDEETARRALRLARAAEGAAGGAGGELPVYIIGTEVPVPGGADHAITELEPTSPEAAAKTLDVHRRLFREAGLDAAFSRVIGLVVQPGVEFGNENVVVYDPPKARGLTRLLEGEPGLVYEAHSTDYQGRAALRHLVEDGFAILKVGPELTFVLREALYGLDLIASDLLADYPSRRLFSTMEALMLTSPANWQGHYHGDAQQQFVDRHYSFSDRIRYYWNQPEAEAAVRHLLDALRGRHVPPTLFRQHLPVFEYFAGSAIEPADLLIAAVERSLDDYRFGCTGETDSSHPHPDRFEQETSMRLKDKIALITGGARGIGLGFAQEFVRQGAKVVIADINIDAARAAAQSFGAGASAKKLDVTQVADIEKVVAEVVAEFGGIDILVNNAAIFDLDPIQDITEASYEKVMNVNLKGPLFVMREVSRVMIKRGRGGKIINMASQAGRRGEALVTLYCASKAAIISATQSAALALVKHGINVNAIAPGVVDGEHWDYVDARFAVAEGLKPGEKKAAVAKSVPIGRFATPDDIKGLAVFLASSDSDYILAQTYNCDGGNWMS